MSPISEATQAHIHMLHAKSCPQAEGFHYYHNDVSVWQGLMVEMWRLEERPDLAITTVVFHFVKQ